MKSIIKLVFILSILVSCSAFGLDISNVKVHSEIYHALDADVQLSNPSSIPVEKIQASLAPMQAYFLRGVQFDPQFEELHFTVVKATNGDPIIKVTSLVPIKQPILSFLVALQWPQGEVIKEFILLPQMPGQGDEMPLIAKNNKHVVDNKYQNFIADVKDIVRKALLELLSFTT